MTTPLARRVRRIVLGLEAHPTVRRFLVPAGFALWIVAIVVSIAAGAHHDLVVAADCLRIGNMILAAVAFGLTVPLAITLRYSERAQVDVKLLQEHLDALMRAVSLILLGTSLLILSVFYTELDRLGTPLTVRLPTNLLGVIAVLLGAALMTVVVRARR